MPGRFEGVKKGICKGESAIQPTFRCRDIDQQLLEGLEVLTLIDRTT